MFATALPKANKLYYAQLAYGARYLASRACGDADRREHLGMAERYSQLALASSGDNC